MYLENFSLLSTFLSLERFRLPIVLRLPLGLSFFSHSKETLTQSSCEEILKCDSVKIRKAVVI